MRAATQTMTVEEYLVFEEASEIRHEFMDGKLYEMAGTTDYHNFICGNIYILLRQLLKGSTCKVFQENIKLRVLDKKYTYPDVFITCDERDAQSRLIKQYPSVIVEILSDKTRVYDKTDKFIMYQNIPTLKHYLTVEPEKPLVEVYSLQDDGVWEVETYTQITDTFSISSLGISLKMVDIYEDK